MNKIYEINSGRAISEMLDGETIIIDLETGSYYSMNETGSAVWNCIQSGFSIEQMIQYFTDRYEVEKKTVDESISALLNLLEADELIRMIDRTSNASVENFSGTKKKFETPKIEKYDDMQEMLLADPIHDVDAVGWPKMKEGK